MHRHWGHTNVHVTWSNDVTWGRAVWHDKVNDPVDDDQEDPDKDNQQSSDPQASHPVNSSVVVKLWFSPHDNQAEYNPSDEHGENKWNQYIETIVWEHWVIYNWLKKLNLFF